MNNKFELAQRKPSELLTNKFEALSYIKSGNIDFYADESNYFSHYEYPVITKDNTLLSHIDDVQAAIVNGDAPIPVLVAKDLTKSDYLRFCLKSLYFKGLKTDERNNIIYLIDAHLKSPEGKEWNKALEKKGYNDINKKCGAILNCSSQLIKLERSTKKSIPPKNIPDLNSLQFTFSDGTPRIFYAGKELDKTLSKFEIKQHKNTVTIKFIIKNNQG